MAAHENKELLLTEMLAIIQQDSGIRPSEPNRRLGRTHSPHSRQALINRGLIRKEKIGLAVRYFPKGVE